MYSLRLFYKNYIVYYNVYCYYCSVFIKKYVYTKFCLDWLLCECHLCPYCNVWPEAVGCLLLFYKKVSLPTLSELAKYIA